MSESEKDFINEFKKQVIAIFLLGLLTTATTALAFYYNTQSSIEMLKKEQLMNMQRQKAVEISVQHLHESKIDKDAYIREVDEMKALIKEILHRL